MQLSADRLEVTARERIRAVGMVAVPLVGLIVAGGLDYLRHTLEDTGFHEVELFLAQPRGWTRGQIDKPIGFEWPLWIEATAKRTASFRRELTEEIRVLDAWAAGSDGPAAQEEAPLHPYAVVARAAMRLAGVLRAFAVAYPLSEVA